MARVTIEDCLEKVENRFILIHMAAKRVGQFKKGDVALIKSRNRERSLPPYGRSRRPN